MAEAKVKTVKESVVVTAVGRHSDGIAKAFLKYQGMTLTDDEGTVLMGANGKPLTVSVRWFGQKFGVSRSTLHRWGALQEETPEQKQKREAAAAARDEDKKDALSKFREKRAFIIPKGLEGVEPITAEEFAASLTASVEDQNEPRFVEGKYDSSLARFQTTVEGWVSKLGPDDEDEALRLGQGCAALAGYLEGVYEQAVAQVAAAKVEREQREADKAEKEEAARQAVLAATGS